LDQRCQSTDSGRVRLRTFLAVYAEQITVYMHTLYKTDHAELC